MRRRDGEWRGHAVVGTICLVGAIVGSIWQHDYPTWLIATLGFFAGANLVYALWELRNKYPTETTGGTDDG